MSKAGLNRKDFIFEKKKNEVLIKIPGQINGRDFLISRLEDCEVYVMDHIAQIFIDDCKNCTIHVGPVESSVFIRECENLKVSAACSQYRVSDSKNIDSYIYSQTDPTLENCRNVRFAPYNFAYPHQEEHFEKAKLDPHQNKWSQVFDFNENRADPNWSILPPEEYPGPVQKTVDDMPEPVNPVPVNKVYGGTLDEPIIVGSQEKAGQNDEGMMAFDIQTGANEAQQQFESHEVHIEEHHYQEHHEEHHDFGGAPQNQGQANEAQHQQYQNADYDDFFGSQPLTQASTNVQQSSPTQGFGAPQGVNYGGMGQGMDMYNPDYDPEEEERMHRLRQVEQQRIQMLEEKARIEREKKQEKIANAARELAKWESEREQAIEKRRQINRQNQSIQEEAKGEDEYNNSWDKIVANIATKEGEYPGSKDVTRFRQALINKKSDVARGLNQNLAEF